MFGSRQHRGRREKINRATPASSASRVRRRVFTYLRWILPRGRPTFGSSRTPTPTGFLRDAPCAEPWAYLVGAGFQPLAAAASDEISPRSGHLSGRVAAPTRVGEAGGSRNLTGAPPPQRFSLGLHPVSLGKTKEMGWKGSERYRYSAMYRRVPPARRECARGARAQKGEPPARVPPLTPSCASLAQESSARCGARPGAPPLDPARFFAKKRGKKLLNALAFAVS